MRDKVFSDVLILLVSGVYDCIFYVIWDWCWYNIMVFEKVVGYVLLFVYLSLIYLVIYLFYFVMFYFV